MMNEEGARPIRRWEDQVGAYVIGSRYVSLLHAKLKYWRQEECEKQSQLELTRSDGSTMMTLCGQGAEKCNL